MSSSEEEYISDDPSVEDDDFWLAPRPPQSQTQASKPIERQARGPRKKVSKKEAPPGWNPPVFGEPAEKDSFSWSRALLNESPEGVFRSRSPSPNMSEFSGRGRGGRGKRGSFPFHGRRGGHQDGFSLVNPHLSPRRKDSDVERDLDSPPSFSTFPAAPSIGIASTSRRVPPAFPPSLPGSTGVSAVRGSNYPSSSLFGLQEGNSNSNSSSSGGGNNNPFSRDFDAGRGGHRGGRGGHRGGRGGGLGIGGGERPLAAEAPVLGGLVAPSNAGEVAQGSVFGNSFGGGGFGVGGAFGGPSNEDEDQRMLELAIEQSIRDAEAARAEAAAAANAREDPGERAEEGRVESAQQDGGDGSPVEEEERGEERSCSSGEERSSLSGDEEENMLMEGEGGEGEEEEEEEELAQALLASLQEAGRPPL